MNTTIQILQAQQVNKADCLDERNDNHAAENNLVAVAEVEVDCLE